MKTKSLLSVFCYCFLLCLFLASCSQARYSQRFDHRDYVTLGAGEDPADPVNAQSDTAMLVQDLPEPVLQQGASESPEKAVNRVQSSAETTVPVVVSLPLVKKLKRAAANYSVEKVGKEWISNVENNTPLMLSPDKTSEKSAGFGLRLVGWILIIAGLIILFTINIPVGVIFMLLGLLFVIVGIRARD